MSPKIWTVLRACTSFSELAAWDLALVFAIRSDLLWALTSAVFALGTGVLGRIWSRKFPIPIN